MPLRPPAGFISANYDPLRNPDAPTGVEASAGDAQASVSFTAPVNVGGSAISSYYAVSNPGQITASGASSPVTVTGLTNGTAYTFQVWALNTFGPGAFSAASGSVTPAAVRGLFGGGSSAGPNVIDYISISSTGNAIDFGDLTVARLELAACSSSVRGVWAGGYSTNGATYYRTIDYVTIATTGNATNFGNLQTPGKRGIAGCSSSTRGVFAGGYSADTSLLYNVIDYITIATTGNATDFGDLSATRFVLASASSSTRGLFGGGNTVSSGTPSANIYYITIATTGNTTSFGSLSLARGELAACASSTRALFSGGSDTGGTRQNIIDYVTIATTGNATDFGDLIAATDGVSSCSSELRGIIAGGTSTGITNVIQYVTIASTGNAIDFGDLTVARTGLAACSSGHGGLS